MLHVQLHKVSVCVMSSDQFIEECDKLYIHFYTVWFIDVRGAQLPTCSELNTDSERLSVVRRHHV